MIALHPTTVLKLILEVFEFLNILFLLQTDDGNLCEIHRRHLEVVCLECRCMICTNCALFGLHRGHNIYSKEDILTMLEKKGEELVIKIIRFMLSMSN